MGNYLVEKVKAAPNKIKREIVRRNPALRALSDLSYEAALKRHINYLPSLSTADQTLVNCLKQEGVFITSLETLAIPSSSLLVNGVNSLLPEFKTNSYSHKERAVGFPMSRRMNYPITILWGLEERLLDIVENYIGLPITYCGADFRVEIANGQSTDVRQWHVDVQDRRMLKIIIYFNDVTVGGGPFEYISKPLTSLTSQSLKYSSGFVLDEVMKTVVPISDWKPCLGSFGTVIFADTCNIFHRAQAPVVSERYSITFSYVSKRPIKEYYTSTYSTPHLITLTKNLSKRQKECFSEKF